MSSTTTCTNSNFPNDL